MRFTAEQAFEASAEGEPILLSLDDVARICRAHGLDHAEYLADLAGSGKATNDAAELFGWLGY